MARGQKLLLQGQGEVKGILIEGKMYVEHPKSR